MSTGDLKNNIKKLQTQLKTTRYSGKLDLDGIRDGSPTAFLPLFHYLFTSYSNRLNRDISNSNNELYGKSDLRFIEAVYKILRDMFSYKPPVTREQFFQSGFAERKVIMATEILRHVQSSYNPPASSSSYKLASKLEKRHQDIHAKVQSSIADNHKAPSKPRKVAGKPVADLTEAIVLPRYMSSSTASSLSHDYRDNSRPSGPTTPATELSDSESPSHHSQSKSSPRTMVSEEADPVSTQFTQHITNALTMLNTQVGKISAALEKVETQIASNESPRARQAVPPASTTVPDKLQMETLVSKVILLENRMTLLETKVDDIQAFCTILLEDRTNSSNNNNSNNNNNSHSPGTSNKRDDKIPTASIITSASGETAEVNERAIHQPGRDNRRMHPDYVKAFAPVADIVGVSSTVEGSNGSRHDDRIKERVVTVAAADDVGDECDADDDITIENVVVGEDRDGEDVGHRDRTGQLKFMKALIGPNDSEISLPRDQDDSAILLSLQQQELDARTQSDRYTHPDNNPNTRTRNTQNSHVHSHTNEHVPKGSSQPLVNDNSFGNAFSPIRGIRDSSLVGHEDSGVIHIPYGLEDDGLESRRLSSTPNKAADLDTSTLSRVNRIMQMMKETQEHFHQSS